jgi:hypothetical protein
LVGDDAYAFDLDALQGLGEPDCEAPDSAVAYQHVRPAAEHRDRDAVFAGLLYGLYQLVGVAGFEERVGGSPDLPRRVALERLVELGRRKESV